MDSISKRPEYVAFFIFLEIQHTAVHKIIVSVKSTISNSNFMGNLGRWYLISQEEIQIEDPYLAKSTAGLLERMCCHDLLYNSC